MATVNFDKSIKAFTDFFKEGFFEEASYRLKNAVTAAREDGNVSDHEGSLLISSFDLVESEDLDLIDRMEINRIYKEAFPYAQRVKSFVKNNLLELADNMERFTTGANYLSGFNVSTFDGTRVFSVDTDYYLLYAAANGFSKHNLHDGFNRALRGNSERREAERIVGQTFKLYHAYQDLVEYSGACLFVDSDITDCVRDTAMRIRLLASFVE